MSYCQQDIMLSVYQCNYYDAIYDSLDVILSTRYYVIRESM